MVSAITIIYFLLDVLKEYLYILMLSFQKTVLARYPGGVLGISSDGDGRRIFLGLKFLIPGFFGVRKSRKYFFGYLDLSRDFLGVLKRIGSTLAA